MAAQGRNVSIALLRGFAILAVVANHFANDYISGPWRDYANGFIGLFFIVSGYLALYSLDNPGPLSRFGAMVFYYVKRVVRLYPMFLVWILMGMLVWGDSFAPNILILKSPAPWFINAIAQCYLFAYIFHAPVKRLRFRSALVAVVAIFALAALAVYCIEGMNRRPYAYRQLPAAHILLFGLGMFAHEHMDRLKRLARLPFLVCAALYLASVYATRHVLELPPGPAMLAGGAFVAATALLFVRCMLADPRTRGLGWLMAAGNASYSIYLLHPYYVRTLEGMHLVHKDSLLTVAIVAGAFPVFYVVASRLERWTGLLGKWFLGRVRRMLLKMQT